MGTLEDEVARRRRAEEERDRALDSLRRLLEAQKAVRTSSKEVAERALAAQRESDAAYEAVRADREQKTQELLTTKRELDELKYERAVEDAEESLSKDVMFMKRALELSEARWEGAVAAAEWLRRERDLALVALRNLDLALAAERWERHRAAVRSSQRPALTSAIPPPPSAQANSTSMLPPPAPTPAPPAPGSVLVKVPPSAASPLSRTEPGDEDEITSGEDDDYRVGTSS